MAKSEDDVRATKFARTELTKRGFDLSLADLRVMHATLHIRGAVRMAAGAEFSGSIKEELERVCNLLRQKPGIKDVAINVTIRT